MNEKDLEKKLITLIERILPNILRNGNNSVRSGIVNDVNAPSRTVQVTVDGTGQTLLGVKYIGNATPAVGAGCILISPDPALKGKVVALVFN